MIILRRSQRSQRYRLLAIKIEAMRKLGEMLEVKPNAKPGRKTDMCSTVEYISESLKELGIDRKVAMVAQQLAAMPDQQFEQVREGVQTVSEALKYMRQEKVRDERSALAKKVREEKIPDREASKIITGDFRNIMASMPDNSVDMIFTDPPYDADSIVLYGDLARLAARVLKPNGSLITYVGHYAVLDVGNLMREHLRFWWMMALVHGGQAARLPGKWVFVEWKPLMWFVKGGRNNNNYVADLFKSNPPTKKEHDWQQDTSEACYYIEQLTLPGDIVLDPFAGSGTTILAANSIGRRAIGIELDDERAMIARGRINAIS